MQPRITVVTLGVKDLARARRFYLEGLGWKEAPGSNEQVSFIQMTTGIVLALWSRESLAEDAHVPATGDGFRSISIAHNCHSRAEVDEVFALVEKAGAKILKKPQEVFWGGYSGYFADPDGHLWEVAHNPFWNMDAQGHVKL